MVRDFLVCILLMTPTFCPVLGEGPVPTATTVHTAYVSVTFQNILSRVVARDKETNAITKVAPKEDAPQNQSDLDFSITQDTTREEVRVVVSEHTMIGRTYEQYLLRMDDAIREELKKANRLRAALARKENERIDQQNKKIGELTGGRLRYGMSQNEVEGAMGKPDKVVEGAAQRVMFDLVYRRFVVHMVADTRDPYVTDVDPIETK
jgi:hypothetical protein